MKITNNAKITTFVELPNVLSGKEGNQELFPHEEYRI